MEIIAFEPKFSMKDSKWRVRVVGSTKGVLGQSVEKTGFLKFDDQETAQTAFDTIQGGGVALEFTAPNPQGIYEVAVALTNVVAH